MTANFPGIDKLIEGLEAERDKLRIRTKREGCGFDNWLSEALAKVEAKLEALREVREAVEAMIKEEIPLFDKANNTDETIFLSRAYEGVISAYLNVIGIKKEWVTTEELLKLLEGEGK